MTNPYQIDPNQNYSAPPSEQIQSDDGITFIPQGKKVDAGAGTSWISRGFELFKANPGTMIGMAVVLFVIHLALNFTLGLIPIIGPLAIQVIATILTGGVMIACHAQVTGDGMKFEHLFAGFKEKAGDLALFGVFWALAMLVVGILVGIVVAVFVGGAIATGAVASSASGNAGFMGIGIGAIIVMLIVGVILFIPIMMAAAFAPALIVFHNIKPIDAIGKSLGASMKNFGPFIIFFLLMFVIILVAAIPLGLGLLVAFPVLWGATYWAYRDMFTE